MPEADPNLLFNVGKRNRSLVYQNSEVHLSLLNLLLALLLDRRGALNEEYCVRHPVIEGKPDYLKVLVQHLNHPGNEDMKEAWLRWVAGVSDAKGGQGCLF